MSDGPNVILSRMLDRLFASIVSGPSLSCRPHASRQRLDLTRLAHLRSVGPGEAMLRLLSDDAEVSVAASVPSPPVRIAKPPRASGGSISSASSERVSASPLEEPDESPEAMAARKAWTDQQSTLSRLRVIAEEASTYEDDTGVCVLSVGFPLLSLPPGDLGGTGRGGFARNSRRILAPIAFVPVSVTVRPGAAGGVKIACRSDEVDRVQPNQALLAWIEQQTGEKMPDLSFDDEGSRPWREISGIVAAIAGALRLQPPGLFMPTPPAPDQPESEADPFAPPPSLELLPAPRSEDDEAGPSIVAAAVLGLFPASNQSLLRDTQEMIESPPEKSTDGPVSTFIRAGVSLECAAGSAPLRKDAPSDRILSEERLIAAADPCQARAVALARQSPALVIHGPPGTGKSQTITNIIGDHLARGERILFVCDKRTALDVVANRLEHLGLGNLCALVHDPQRDQRHLYMSIREQMEALVETTSNPRAEHEIAAADAELSRLRDELTGHHTLLMRPPGGDPAGRSIHELIGEWLGLPPDYDRHFDGGSIAGLDPAEIDAHRLDLADAFARARCTPTEGNTWVTAAGVTLATLLARPMDAWRGAMDRCVAAATAADATLPAGAAPIPLPSDAALKEAAASRRAFAQSLEDALSTVATPCRRLWASRDAAAVRAASLSLQDAKPLLTILRSGPIDAELQPVLREQPLTAVQMSQRLGALETYLQSARGVLAFLAFGAKKAARAVLEPMGLALNAENAERARSFLQQARAAVALAELRSRFEQSPPSTGVADIAELDTSLSAHIRIIHLLAATLDDPRLTDARAAVVEALAATSEELGRRAVESIRRSADRAEALVEVESALSASALLNREWLAAAGANFRKGDRCGPMIESLRSRLGTLEDVLRIRETTAKLPAPMRPAVQSLMAAAIEPAAAIGCLRRAVLAGEISRRLVASPQLLEMDARRLQSIFDRYRELEATKQRLVREAILHRWVTRQRERLLVGTYSRLNSTGADLKRRLTTRGQRALRLRQVVALGRAIEGGDPLMDLRPVWMASPETVAQLFPREAVFDTVIFDEASQCRLEEAIPVLTRARRIVIAGDPKQLPPSRFFESAVAASESEEIETDEQLFDAQQSEVEDLLAAALNLDIQSSYLDVHYRSRNADLIAFSNEQFYSSRLQPIPGHPSRIARFAPINLYRASGVYDKRVNEIEAEQVVRIIRDLLRRADPPSIGVGCFNIAQRDLIAEKLDELAAEDGDFADRLATARSRRGSASFEGLFVKNLENVQGDERDHIIISTTYGPDPTGRFYRRFGPLAQPGGGRRLNVLVTRARHEVHLVTSIPASVYRALPPVPQRQVAGGGWLLFAYLRYAEELASAYEAIHAPPTATIVATSAADAAAKPDNCENTASAAPPVPTVPPAPRIDVRSSRTPSPLAEALASTLARTSSTSSTVHWGNDGFCIDVALHHPQRADDVTVGVLCDFARFHLADDPVEWDIFRTAVLADQGWSLFRLWSPSFFRDPTGIHQAILAQADNVLRDEKPADAIPVA